jgi:extradiol dioxygenase family protein
MQSSIFHLAIPVNDLAQTQAFYTQTLGCQVGRTSEHWIDFNFFGHQLSAHLVQPSAVSVEQTNRVDGKQVPVRHFGLVLSWSDWHNLAEKLSSQAIDFLIEPCIRFSGKIGEQGTFFINDPSDNALEFKTFKNMDQLFAH